MFIRFVSQFCSRVMEWDLSVMWLVVKYCSVGKILGTKQGRYDRMSQNSISVRLTVFFSLPFYGKKATLNSKFSSMYKLIHHRLTHIFPEKSLNY